MNNVWRWLAIIFLMTCLLVVWWKADYGSMVIGRGDFWDARNYLHTVADVGRGWSPYDLIYMQTLGPPMVIIPYVWLSWLPERLALATFATLSLAAGLAMCWWLSRCVTQAIARPRDRLVVTLLLLLILLSAFPTRFNFITGQWGLVAAFLVTVMLLVKGARRRGVALGLLTISKTFFGFSWLTLVRKNRSVLLWATITLVVIFVAALPIFTWSHYQQYRDRFQRVMWQPDRIINVAYYNQSLKTSLSRLGLVEWSVPIWIVVAAVAAGYLIWSQNLPAGIALSVILSPVAWQHYFVVLFPLLIWVLPKLTSWQWRWVWLISFGLWWIEFSWLHFQPLNLWTGILGSHYLISALLLTSILVYNHHRV